METHEFKYLPHVKWWPFAVVVFYLLLLGPEAANAVRAWLAGESIPLFASIMLLLLLLFGPYGVWAIWDGYARSSGRFIVDDDSIRYSKDGQDVRLPFDEIVALQFPSFFSPKMKIKSRDREISVAGDLEDLTGLLVLVKYKLGEAGNPAVYDREEFYRFYEKAAYISQYWERTYRWFPKIAAATVIGFGLFVVALFIADNPEDQTNWPVVFLGFAVGLGPVFGYLIAELLIRHSFWNARSEEPSAIPEADPAQERRSLLIGYAICTVLTVTGTLTLIIAPL